MRLLVVSQYFWPENVRVNDLAAELAVRGHDVTVLTGYPNYPDGRIYPSFAEHPEQFESYCGVRVVRVPLVPRGRGRLTLAFNYLSYAISASILGAWRLRREKFDAIFVFQGSPVFVGIPAVVMRFLKRAPSAIWVLDVWPESLRAVGVIRSQFLLDLVGLVVSWIYRRCDLVLAQSNSFIAEIKKYSGARPVVYFANWAEPIFETATVAPAPEVKTEAGRFNIMFAGNIGDAQDFPTLLDAAELLKTQMPAIRWLILGDGSKAEWVKGEIVRRGLQDAVIMLGKFPVERMPAFYEHADVFFLALKDDAIFAMTIPGKLQSYLAAGKPVLAMLNGEGADVITRSKSGYACPAGSAERLAAAARAMASLPSERLMQMGRNARAISQTEFDRERQIGKLETWLQQLTLS